MGSINRITPEFQKSIFNFLDQAEPWKIRALLHSHKKVLPTSLFLECLVKIYDEEKLETKVKMYEIIILWIDMRFQTDFWFQKNSYHLIRQLLNFGVKTDVGISSPKNLKEGRLCSNQIKLRILRSAPDSETQTNKSKSSRWVHPSQFRKEMFRSGKDFEEWFLFLPPSSVADNFSILQWKTFIKVEGHELVHNAWKTQSSFSYVRKLVEDFNMLSHFVCSWVLSLNNGQVRTKILAKWIAVGSACFDRRNFQAGMAILAALNMHPVSRIKEDWEKLSDKLKENKQKMDELMDPRQNYKKYRETIASTSSWALPYFGLFTRDILFIEEGNSALREDGLLNVDRFEMIGNVLKEIQTYQRKKIPKMDEVKELSGYLNSLFAVDEVGLDEMSHDLKPVGGALKSSASNIMGVGRSSSQQEKFHSFTEGQNHTPITRSSITSSIIGGSPKIKGDRTRMIQGQAQSTDNLFERKSTLK